MHINPKGQSVSKSSSICMQEIKPLTDDTKYNARSSLVRSSLVHSSLYTSFFNKSWNYDTPISHLRCTRNTTASSILHPLCDFWTNTSRLKHLIIRYEDYTQYGIFSFYGSYMWFYLISQRIKLFWHARTVGINNSIRLTRSSYVLVIFEWHIHVNVLSTELNNKSNIFYYMYCHRRLILGFCWRAPKRSPFTCNLLASSVMIKSILLYPFSTAGWLLDFVGETPSALLLLAIFLQALLWSNLFYYIHSPPPVDSWILLEIP